MRDMIAITRRSLLMGMGGSPILFAIQQPRRRPKLAAICTTYFKYSHAQHIADRFLEYRDGLRATLLMLNGAVKDFTFAARVKGAGVQSTQFFLSPEPNVTYSQCLVAKIEELFSTGKAPYPVERTLLVSGILESCLTSRLEGQKRLETPHLDVRYRAAQQSQHARG